MDHQAILATIQANVHQRRGSGILGDGDPAANQAFVRSPELEMFGLHADLHGSRRGAEFRGQAHGGQAAGCSSSGCR